MVSEFIVSLASSTSYSRNLANYMHQISRCGFMQGQGGKVLPEKQMNLLTIVYMYRARVVRLNPPPAPLSNRLLIEMEGRWDNHEPMSGPDYEPLA